MTPFRPHNLRFNEARAFSAGNQDRFMATLAAEDGFNEARAFSAGNLGLGGIRGARIAHASMRPAHSAREIQEGASLLDGGDAASMRPAHSAREIWTLQAFLPGKFGCFNEARAFSAGNHLGWRLHAVGYPRFNEARAFSAGNLVSTNPMSSESLPLQ